MPIFLGVRHLSPNGAYHVRQELDKIQPKVVLIEGPADFSPLIDEVATTEVKPPFAILSYTTQKPIKTILIPLAEYSPEYQAILWARDNGAECKFIDLPSNIVLAYDEHSNPMENTSGEWNVHRELNKYVGGYDSFWESVIEHKTSGYFDTVNQFGKEIRSLDNSSEYDVAVNTLRESHMKREIDKYSSYGENEVAVICGAFHVDGLANTAQPISDKELKGIDSVDTKYTLMPYTYFKLSSQSGYGAGNKAPNYYHMLWNCIQNGDVGELAFRYLTLIAREMRAGGYNTSSALVIDAVNLANSLARLKDRLYPTLKDLEDACITCFGEGSLAPVVHAQTLVQIGKQMGSLPQGVSNTALQQDFNMYIKMLKLDKYLSDSSEEITLDLRENIHVKKAQNAYIDLHRSFFFNQLSVLGVTFANKLAGGQDNASWKEVWHLQWSTDVEIQLVEGSLLGETLEKAVVAHMAHQLEEQPGIDTVTAQIKNSFLCGLPQALNEFVAILQASSIDNTDFYALANCMNNLSVIITYGDLRKVHTHNIEEMLKEIYTRSALVAEDATYCSDEQVSRITGCFNIVNQLSTSLDFLNVDLWIEALEKTAENLQNNQFLAGYATGLLLERGKLTEVEVLDAIEFHLSKGMDSGKAANWLEGFCVKNHYQLILNLKIWEKLDSYIGSLSEDEFMPVLVFLRRAFARFTGNEKDSIVDNLKEIWGVTIDNSEVLTDVSSAELDFGDFDFDDL